MKKLLCDFWMIMLIDINKSIKPTIHCIELYMNFIMCQSLIKLTCITSRMKADERIETNSIFSSAFNFYIVDKKPSQYCAVEIVQYDFTHNTEWQCLIIHSTKFVRMV